MADKHQKRKRVSIIIPFYGQTEAELALPLASINMQIGIDFERIDVHLVNDGGPEIDMSKFELFENLDLHYHRLAVNSGPGVARQYGIDQSHGEYLMFMDADDTFNAAGTLLDFFVLLDKTGAHQVISMSFIEQQDAGNGKSTFHIHSNQDAAAVYSKWFNRRFLEDYHIRFKPELRVFEDSYFLQCILLVTTNISYGQAIAYVWRNNSNSLMRSDGGAAIHQTDQWVIMNRLQLEFVNRFRPRELASRLEGALSVIYLSYKKYPADNDEKFWEEMETLRKEFSYAWGGYTERLRKTVDDIASKPGVFSTEDTSDLEDFLARVK